MRNAGSANRVAAVFREEKMGNLIVKSLFGFVFLMVVLAAALFGSAGSLQFWQAQIYLANFALCTILVTAYLIKHDQELLAGRVKAGPVAETERSQQIIQSLASLLFIGLFIIAGLDFRFGWSDVPSVLSLIANGGAALGFYVVFLVFRENSYTRATIEVSAGQRVITTGPYGVVRHPMYTGASILLIFTPIALGSWVAIPFAIMIILAVAVRLLDEERFLSANLSGYTEYRRKVYYRLIPFIW